VVEHIRLREELDAAPWLHLTGNLTWEPQVTRGATEPDVPIQGERLVDKVARLRGWNYPLEQVSRAEVGRRFPAIRFPDGVDDAVFFPLEGYADAPLLAASLARRAAGLGATIATGSRVVGFILHETRLKGVVTADGVHHHADIVVLCAGRWTRDLLAIAGVAFPMRPTLGLLAVTSPVASTHQTLVHAPGVNIRPDGGGRYLLANYALDASLEEDESPDSLLAKAESLLAPAARVLPALAGARIESYRLGIRSIPADGFPAVGPVPRFPGFHVVATHSGVTMGPLLARLTAQELLDGHKDDCLAPYRPDRIVGSARTAG
jgi:glycine/D-amino acid oxidase-like deaminating enzyme